MVAEVAGAAMCMWATIVGFLVLLSLASVGFIIWGIVDIARAKNNSEWKALWILVCIAGGLIGVIVYLIVGRKDKKGGRKKKSKGS